MNGVLEFPMRHEDHLRGAHLGEKLHELLDGELTRPEQENALAHLSECDACAAEHDRLAETLTALRGLGEARAPRGFSSRVLRRTRAHRRGRLRLVAHLRAPYEVAVVVLLAAALAVLVMGQTFGWGEGRFEWTEPPPTTGIKNP